MTVAPRRTVTALVALLLLPAGCTSAKGSPESTDAPSAPPAPSSAPASTAPSAAALDLLPGMPPLLDPADVYAADRPNALAPQVRNDPPRIYVPSLQSNSVTVIDPATYKVIKTIPVGRSPQHVVPSWDLRTLWVNNNVGNSLTPIDPATGNAGKPVPVDDPYNLYFTPDGAYAIVMAEAKKQIVFRDPHTMEVRKVVPVECDGVNHVDFSRDGRYFIATCEFSMQLIKVDTVQQKVVAKLKLPSHGMPQDIKISPDGSMWYVADMAANGVWLLDGDAFTIRSLLPTGKGAHGLYPSRDSKQLYVANRGEGTVSVVDFATSKIAKTWKIPGKASPDMGGVSADGKVLWLSGRYDNEVYAIDTTSGDLLSRIKVGTEPHGLCVWPQPGRYSLGHTGILR